MLGSAPHTFISLPHERTLYTSPQRTSFTLASPGTFTYTASTGVVHITNQRVPSPPPPPLPHLLTKTDYLHPHPHLEQHLRIFLRADNKLPRLPRRCAILWAKHMVCVRSARCGRRDPARHIGDRNEAGV